MNIVEIEGLLHQLETAEAGWPGATSRATVLARLRDESSLDWGDDPASWRAWWCAVRSELERPPPAPVPTTAQAHALQALHELGVEVDAETLMRRDRETFPRRTPSVADYVEMYDRRRIWLSDACGAYCRTEYERTRTAKKIQTALGSDAQVSVRALEHGFALTLDGRSSEITSAPRQTVVRILHEWLHARGDRRSVWLDPSGHARVLTPEQLAAFRRYRPVRFLHVHRAALGTPHPDVAHALAELAAIRVDLAIAPSRLAWEVSEYDSAHDEAQYSYHTQLLHLAQAGVEATMSRWVDSHPVTSKLSMLTGVRLAPPRVREVEPFVAALNRQLRSSSLRVVALPVQRRWLRFMPLPADRIGALSRWTQLSWGGERLPRPRRTGATFRVTRPPAMEELVPADRIFVFDGECVADSGEYEVLVRDILASTRGQVLADEIECIEEDDEDGVGRTRVLRIAARSTSFEARLRGNTDWVDVPPLVECLNQLAAHLGRTRRFYAVRDLTWEEEAGLAYATVEEGRALARAGFLVTADGPVDGR